jgi:hypothetical protein
MASHATLPWRILRILAMLLAIIRIDTCFGVSSSSSYGYPTVEGALPPPARGLTMSSQEESDAPSSVVDTSGKGKGGKKRSLKDMGLMEGQGDSDEQTYMLTTPEDNRSGRMPGAFTGRNPKLLKHRRLDAVEVAQRRLDKDGIIRPDGGLDMEGMSKLLEAQAEREIGQEQGMDGPAPARQWTMEDLDRTYETEEGNRRLGLARDAPEEVDTQTRKRWERRSHLVDMRERSRMNVDTLIPEDELNYRKYQEEFTVFAQGSTGVRYAVEVSLMDTVAVLKSKIWELEYKYRYPEGSGRRAKDEQEGFKVADI